MVWWRFYCLRTWKTGKWNLLSTKTSWRRVSGQNEALVKGLAWILLRCCGMTFKRSSIPENPPTRLNYNNSAEMSGPKFLQSSVKKLLLQVIAIDWLQLLKRRVAKPVIRFRGQSLFHTGPKYEIRKGIIFHSAVYKKKLVVLVWLHYKKASFNYCLHNIYMISILCRMLTLLTWYAWYYPKL